MEPVPGRGASFNPPNRFERFHVAAPEDEEVLPPEEQVSPRTILLEDASRTILSRNDSPDVGFDVSVNPYRGCEHGCVYCYARPTHEYLGFSAGLDFETRILVKRRAPELLRAELMSPAWNPETIVFSGVTDCYQPVERRLRLTRSCLEVLAEFRNPAAVITKNELVSRDADVLAELARWNAGAAFVSITSLDAELTRILEPRTSTPARRLSAVSALASAGVPTGVMIAPVIPGLNDHEIPAILKAAKAAGARTAGFIVLRLPGAVLPLFERWLEDHFPDRKEKVLSRIRDLRDGKLNDPRFGSRMRGTGAWADEIQQLFAISRRRAGLSEKRWPLSAEAFRRPVPVGGQLSLFGPE